MSVLSAEGFPEEQVRHRARAGAAAAFPALESYGSSLLGAIPAYHDPYDLLERARIVPPVFMPERLKKLIDLAREPLYTDVELGTSVGGFASRLPLYVSAFGSTQVASHDLGEAAGRQAGQLGIPMVIGENVVPVNGYRAASDSGSSPLLGRIAAYTAAADDEHGGVVVQQSTEDADAEVWNQVYSDPVSEPLLATGRLRLRTEGRPGCQAGARRPHRPGPRGRLAGSPNSTPWTRCSARTATRSCGSAAPAPSPRRSCASRSG